MVSWSFQLLIKASSGFWNLLNRLEAFNGFQKLSIWLQEMQEIFPNAIKPLIWNVIQRFGKAVGFFANCLGPLSLKLFRKPGKASLKGQLSYDAQLGLLIFLLDCPFKCANIHKYYAFPFKKCELFFQKLSWKQAFHQIHKIYPVFSHIFVRSMPWRKAMSRPEN